jgi:Asp-tRNA(Asn)/Glu-tRNA(Gln) amidotransferase A subunit family amidase
MDSLHYLTLGELASRLESRAVSPVDVTRQMLERIDALDGFGSGLDSESELDSNSGSERGCETAPLR